MNKQWKYNTTNSKPSVDLMGNPIDQKKLDKELNKLANQIAAKRKRLH